MALFSCLELRPDVQNLTFDDIAELAQLRKLRVLLLDPLSNNGLSYANLNCKMIIL